MWNSPGGVETKELFSVYEHFLEPQGVDLVVYSDKYQDCIVYDSRTDENGDLIKLTDKIVCLWLNNNHYDVVLNMRKFSKLNPSSFCVKCMSYFSSFEHSDNYICNSNLTCQKCFKQSKCLTNCKIECSNCCRRQLTNLDMGYLCLMPRPLYAPIYSQRYLDI